MFVLGIDPGLTRCGFGLVEGALEGPEAFRALRCGTLETSASLSTEARLAQLYGDLVALYDEFTPDVVVVERVFFQRNAKTAIPVAQAAGVAIALAGVRGTPVRQFTAQQAKLAVTGYGAASKDQVQHMVARTCGLTSLPQPADAADALGLAITYLLTERVERRVVTEATA
jgi:crossover junction endodeoxyribonuclease RuvC